MSVWLKTTIVLLIASLVVISVEESRIRRAQAREAVAALATTNVIAERDSTRDLARVNARVARLVGDSIRVVEKRVLQAEQESDALDRALGGERKAKFALVARLDSLLVVTAAPARGDSGVRRASFAVRQAPYSVEADIWIPPPPDSGRIALKVELDPISIDARIRCTNRDVHGVRAASVVVSAPEWTRVRLERLEQSPEVCMPIPSGAMGRSLPSMWPVVGVGIVSSARGRPTIGGFLGIGVGVRR